MQEPAVNSCPRRFAPIAGTREHSWATLLENQPVWSPREGPLVIVSPHPDDEVLAAGGLIHSWAALGRPVTVVSVTDGEAAVPQWKGLDVVRRGELKGALRTLCTTHVSILRLGLPDGGVARFANRLRNSLLASIVPRVTLVAPYEHGHPDHEAVAAVCAGLARSHGLDLVRYPGSCHHTDLHRLADARWGRFLLSAEARRAKARAVRCFDSHMQPHAAPMPAYEAFLL